MTVEPGSTRHRLLVAVYGLIPPSIRSRIVHVLAPSHILGAMVAVRSPRGRVMLVRHSYNRAWGLPGGLVDRGEQPAIAARRELREEVGMVVELLGDPSVTVDQRQRVTRIGWVARAGDDDPETTTRPTSPEIIEVGWFEPDALPALNLESLQLIEVLRRSPQWAATDGLVADGGDSTMPADDAGGDTTTPADAEGES